MRKLIFVIVFFSAIVSSGCQHKQHQDWQNFQVTITFDRTNAHAPAGHTNELNSVRRSIIYAQNASVAQAKAMVLFRENEPTAKNVKVKVRRA